MWALEENHPVVAAMLIEGSADVHAKSKAGFTPLSFAARRGDLASARLMLDKGADPNETAPGGLNALLMATDSGEEDFAIFLLEHGANPNSVDRDGASALHIAMRSGMSLLHGVARDPSYADSLDYLFRPPMTRLVKELLDHGANPNARIAKGSRKTPARPSDRPKLGLAGASPLMLAAAAGDVDVMRMLLAKGADPKLTTEDGTTPLMAAAGVGFSDSMTKDGDERGLAAIKLLIELGADPNASNKWGTTALHGAAYTGANEIVRFLVGKGADLNATDQYGQTPLSIAEGDPNYLGDDFERRSNPKTAELIRQLGGDPLATGPGAASVGGVTSVIAGSK
jgi:ankyrin repeat protein